MGKLTATAMKASRKPGRYGDGDGLFLVVSTSGSASWVVRVQKAGRRRDIGIGSAKKVSLATAREKASVVRSQMEAGLDPVAERRKAEGDLRVVRRLEHVSPEGFARFREQLRPYRPSGELGLNAKPPCAEYWSDMDGVRVEWRDGTGNDKLNLNFGCDPENRRAMAEALRAAPNAFGLGPLNVPWGQWVATTPS